MARKSSKSKKEPVYLGVTYVARRISQSERKTRALMDAGVIRCVRDAAGRRVATEDDVAAYLAHHAEVA